ncbi:MAG: DoxX family protein [Pyrinomonadaceae bacterium]
MAALLFVVPLTWSAVLYFIEAPKMVATMTHLGYPMYFLKILGAAKILGVLAIWFSRWPRLKEWAYAGFTFDLIGAFWSHLAVGDPFYVGAIPVGFLFVLAISYVFLHRLKREGKVSA